MSFTAGHNSVKNQNGALYGGCKCPLRASRNAVREEKKLRSHSGADEDYIILNDVMKISEHYSKKILTSSLDLYMEAEISSETLEDLPIY
jgi:hypothetical protein